MPCPAPSLGCRDVGAVRARGLFCLGAALVLGFLLPVVIETRRETQLVFPNFAILGDADVAFLGKLMSLYPLLAGITVIALLYTCPGIGRSVTLMALGLVPILLLLAFSGGGNSFHQLSRVVGPSAAGVSLLGMLGVMGVFAGARARSFCPASRVAAVTGAVGAGLHLLSLLIPAQAAGYRSDSTIALIQPFEWLGDSRTVAFGICGIMCTALGFAASVLCLVNVREGRNAGLLARVAFSLLITDLLLNAACGMVFAVMSEHGLAGVAKGLLPVLIVIAKTSFLVLGLLLLAPVGLTDLIVNIGVRGVSARGGRAPARTVPLPQAPVGVGTIVPQESGGKASELPSGAEDDPARRIMLLQKLLQEGLMTPKEFEKKKTEILSWVGEDPVRRIRRLQELLREGIITPAEFEKKKAEIISGM